MADKVFVPPIKIQGIKTKIVPLIKQVAEFADSDVWFEPFMGSGVVGFNVAPNVHSFLILTHTSLPSIKLSRTAKLPQRMSALIWNLKARSFPS